MFQTEFPFIWADLFYIMNIAKKFYHFNPPIQHYTPAEAPIFMLKSNPTEEIETGALLYYISAGKVSSQPVDLEQHPIGAALKNSPSAMTNVYMYTHKMN